jgi:hypothetical protein
MSPEGRYPRRVPEWLAIQYRDFYDIPHLFVVFADDERIVFESRFDQDRDEYANSFTVYLLPPHLDLPPDSWDALTEGLEPVATVPVSEVTFDPTRRRAVRADTVARVQR